MSFLNRMRRLKYNANGSRSSVWISAAIVRGKTRWTGTPLRASTVFCILCG